MFIKQKINLFNLEAGVSPSTYLWNMLEVYLQSIKNVGKRPICTKNWMMKYFVMFGIAHLFFSIIFKALIHVKLSKEYLARAVLLGANPCTAMVFVWSHFAKGDTTYTLVQVALNDLILLFAFAPIVTFLSNVGGVFHPMVHTVTLCHTLCCHSSYC